MTITQTLTQKEFRNASMSILWSKIGVRIFTALFLVGMIIFPIISAFYTGNYQEIVSPLLFIVVFAVFINFTYKRAYTQNTDLQHPVSYTFKKNELIISGNSGKSTLELPLKKVHEFKHSFGLQQSKQVFYIISKAGLSEQELEFLRKMVN
ncbi:hypothetical protein SAMN05216474_0375 [Lishizhenia tianjinensis]|uniref:YcxB-like protein n=1 Tax=Lishizhenia tianjinensis TaxID=477690 RepID=A0A1I6XQY1_9FLAO|nr:YcxB family protein [Lishizhenia tianjinensis]SFT40452.1 hypothetical protein SAMN05216474_0375 [Lishizhenia tianjinensis]